MFACTQYTLLMEGSGLGFKPMPEKSQDFIDYQQNMGATILCKQQYSLGCFLRHGDHRPRYPPQWCPLYLSNCWLNIPKIFVQPIK